MTMKNIEKSFVYVGTYVKSESGSIFLYEMNSVTGELSFIKTFEGGQNPSYMTFDKNYDYLYAVNETKNYKGKNSGAACAFSVDHKTGFITFLNRVQSLGELPAIISISEDDKVVLIGNYETGSVAVFPVEENGSLKVASDVVQHKGSSVNRERQERAHAHFVIFSPDHRFVFVVDLGMDKILGYHLDTKSGNPKLINQSTVFNSERGSGPRQLCFHPNGKYAYLIHELQSVVTVLSYDNANGNFEKIQTIATIPESFISENKCGGVRVSADGRYLYGSNRGHNSIVVFAINADNGRLSYMENVPSGGSWPREFTIAHAGNLLLVANQHSNDITTFKIDKSSGRLKTTRHRVKVESPAFLQVVPTIG